MQGAGSIQGFGSEARGGQRLTIVAAMRAYLGAVADRDYGSACAALGAPARSSLRRIVLARMRRAGCAATLSALLASSAVRTSRQALSGAVVQVRVGGNRAFVLYRAPGAQLYVFALARERDGWRAAMVAGSVLMP